MKVSILGFNIFNIGGTSRSNLNLIREFTQEGIHDITYYNHTDFSKRDMKEVRKANDYMANVEIKKLSEIYESEEQDLYIVTREDFYPIARFLRAKFPKAIVLGELHAPIALINERCFDFLEYFSYVRVATPSIKQYLSEHLNFERTFTQSVSLIHLADREFRLSGKTKNFVILARFDERSKDISYAIRLMDYIVNFKDEEVYLHIRGSGAAATLYRNLVQYYNLEENIFINEGIPDDYIYLSSARYETLGYSIVESTYSGKAVCLYAGDDGVVYENFQDLQSVYWIQKDLMADAEMLISAMNQVVSDDAIQHDREIIESFSKDYAKKLLNYVSEPVVFPSSLITNLSEDDVNEVKAEIEKLLRVDQLSKYRKVYNQLRKIPLIGRVVGSKRMRDTGKKYLSKWIGVEEEIEEELPIKDNQIFVESFRGKNFSGGPKYLALALREKFPNIQVYVSSRNHLVDIEVRGYGLEPVRLGSQEYLKRFSTSKYVIINGNSLDKAGKREEQVFIQTWHGFPLKKMVADLEISEDRERQWEAFQPRMMKWDYLLTSSSYNTELLTSAFQLHENQSLNVLEIGVPQNSWLIKYKDSEEERRKIYFKYFNRPMETERRFILFCPTWRKGRRNEVSEIDLKELIERLPAEYEIIVKLHPLEGRLRKFYSELDERIHCFYNELVDIQELYLLCDLLISDYSSAIFDFAHTGKRVIVMQEDKEGYSQEIGMYFQIEELGLQGQQYTTDSLLEEILYEADDKHYNELIVTKLMNRDDKKSIEKTIDEIFLL